MTGMVKRFGEKRGLIGTLASRRDPIFMHQVGRGVCHIRPYEYQEKAELHD